MKALRLFSAFISFAFCLIWQAFERPFDSSCGWLKAIRKEQQKKKVGPQ